MDPIREARFSHQPQPPALTAGGASSLSLLAQQTLSASASHSNTKGFTATPLSTPIHQQFNAAMSATTGFGQNMRPDQQGLVHDFLNIALQHDNPQKAFIELVQSEGALKTGAWKDEKAQHIVANLAQFIPLQKFTPTQAPSTSIHHNFNQAMSSGTPFGSRLNTEQKQRIHTILNTALQNADPPATFMQLVNQEGATYHGDWNKEEATNILHNLLPFLSPQPAPPTTDPAILQKFQQALHSSTPLGKNLHSNQPAIILHLVQEAFKTPNPRQTFLHLVDLNTYPKGTAWGHEKANHIKTNLSPLFPSATPMHGSKTASSSIHNNFIATFTQTTFGQHLRPHQRSTLMGILDWALQNQNPRDSFIQAVNQVSTTQGGAWKKDKAAHIISNLAKFVPTA